MNQEAQASISREQFTTRLFVRKRIDKQIKMSYNSIIKFIGGKNNVKKEENKEQ